mmetsp:Transcript_18258/g.21003  ORF Transcript_18258/g.21003 Transcript_18258/m.21003 type:complete len:183 (-) Transcript_18258:32-580(-)|eukprot:CAMPEP_0168330062 /NCGR_PEP_ID=MMETSP0213-20121227/7488_1 /TAXON_ID=151035 /ORGANISM="Euplotes harpa, Strain FSP1.4" /LENGTH=182 /DNA_ID=CAMNT_0008333523 /DNA_START=18 /DNA_END=566 /DNA_ORIENTATION=-
MESCKTIKLTDLMNQVDLSWSDGKVPFFFDTTGNASVFFKYNSVIIEVAKLQISVGLGSMKVDEAKESMRLKFKSAMASGKALIFFLDKVAGKFNTDYFDPEYLPEEIFDPEKITDSEIYMKCVREDENVDMFGGKGNFIMKDGFKVIVLSTRQPDNEDNSQYGERMPLDKMEFITISNESS